MIFEDLSLLKVDKNTSIKPFDCGDEDLNDFLFNKSIPFSEELLATTFLIEGEQKTIAYFSIFNDSLKVEENDFSSRSSLKRFLKSLVTHPKRHLKSFPAIKIGRLAVDVSSKQSGLGKMLVNYIIAQALKHNESCACKLITVDAYEKPPAFYEKRGFEYLSEEDNDKDTRQMYLDLTPYINAIV
ncbi:GNAT family N-acetyltransferase [Emticicia sp. CRIBPO]|uniref:GNAT family N-acetyltransferase n=1 Tax=Emticicia sp. CRIBPO TaxID=2683258 RepID=UPI001412DCE6|nr:GNAT family N-acetyltransferase [Emticicia sp. CRIBPO]NBA89152.1 GNAT family N-acetyltransferase [Emticicia sp. CRIBPO]